MSSAQIDDAPAAEEAAHAPCDFPRLVQFLARQAACVADGAGEPVEERAAGEPRGQRVAGVAGLGCEGVRVDEPDDLAASAGTPLMTRPIAPRID